MAIFALAETLRPDEFAAAIATTAGTSNLSGAPVSLFGYWLERDLDKALSWYESLEPTKRKTFSSTLLETWARIDASATLTWLEKQPEADRKSLAQSGQYVLAQQLGAVHPDRVLPLLMTVDGDSGMIGRVPETGMNSSIGGNQSGVYLFFWSLAAKAPADAAARAMQFPSGTHRTSAAIAVAKSWGKLNPEAAKAWAEKIEDAALSGQVVPACAMGIAQKDPKQAAEWLGSMTATRPNREAMKEVLDAWGEKDLEGALAWLDGLPEDSGAEELTGAVFQTLNRQDPVRALEVMKRRLDENKPLGEGFTGASFTSWLGFSFVDVKGTKEALRFAETSLQHPDSSDSLQAFRSIVNAVAQRNPSETAEWALRQPAGSRRSTALEMAGSFLYEENKERGFNWVNSLPKDADSDSARLSIAGFVFEQDPEKGSNLYTAVTDRETAQERLYNLAHNGLIFRRRGVDEWLDRTTALSPESKTKVRESAQRIINRQQKR